MKLPFFRRPGFPPALARESNLQEIRQRITQTMLWAVSTLGGVACLVAVIDALQHKDWLSLAIFSVGYLWLLAITLAGRRAAYPVRVYSLLGLALAFGVKIMYDNGVAADGEVYLFFVAAMGALLLGGWNAAAFLILPLLAYAVLGFLFTNGILETTNVQDDLKNPVHWLSSWGIYLVMGGLTIVSVQTLLRNLESAVLQSQTLTASLEQEHDRLKQQSQVLQRRQLQLRSAADISRVASSILDVDTLLTTMVNLIQQRFNLYFVGAYLRSGASQEIVLHASAGEGQPFAPEGHRLEVNADTMIGRAMIHRRPRLYLDTAPQPGITPQPELPLSRTVLSLPLNRGAETIGALSLHASQSRAFDEDDITILQGIADSLSVALDNAHLFRERQASLEEIRALNQQYITQAWREIEQSPQAFGYTFENETPASPGAPTQAHSIPLTLRQQAIGHLTLETDQTQLSPEERAFIEAITTQTTLALENARLLEETQRRASREQLVSEIARSAQATSNIETILRSSIQKLGQALRASDGLIQLQLPTGVETSAGNPPDNAQDR